MKRAVYAGGDPAAAGGAETAAAGLPEPTGGKGGGGGGAAGASVGKGAIDPAGCALPRRGVAAAAGSGARQIDDLVVLGNAVPDETRDHRITVCIAGYSRALGLIRVYPTPPKAPTSRWSIIGMPAEQTRHDTRSESWKIVGSKGEWDRLSDKIRSIGQVRASDRRGTWDSICRAHEVGCVNELNDRRASLGIVRPHSVSHALEERADYDPSIQATLTSESMYKTIHNYKTRPVVSYRCPDCTAKNGHRQQILEWGVYEWIRKNPGKAEQVWENLHLDDPGWDKWFLVGNQARYRNAFMIISVIRFKAVPRHAGLFD